MKQFFHYLALQRVVNQNIASGLPYPKIEKSVPQFLTQDEYSRLLVYSGEKARDLPALRNLVMVMLIGTLGIRTATLISLDIGDVDIGCGLLWIVEKGRRRRSLALPVRSFGIQSSHCRSFSLLYEASFPYARERLFTYLWMSLSIVVGSGFCWKIIASKLETISVQSNIQVSRLDSHGLRITQAFPKNRLLLGVCSICWVMRSRFGGEQYLCREQQHDIIRLISPCSALKFPAHIGRRHCATWRPISLRLRKAKGHFFHAVFVEIG
jgi:hypothetical protein